MTDDGSIEALQKLSGKMGFSMKEICEIAKTIVQAEYDPLSPEEWSAVFDEWRRVPVFEDDDFCTLVDPVPLPGAQIDLLRAWLEYTFDRREADYALTHNPSLEQLAGLAHNARHWCKFWAARCPNAKVREGFKAMLAQLEAEHAQNKSRADQILIRHGIVLGDEGNA